MARLYAEAGFAVAIDSVLYPDSVRDFFTAGLDGCALHKIFLNPKVKIALQRNAERTTKAFDAQFLVEPIRAIHSSLAEAVAANSGAADSGAADSDWINVDNSELSLKETVGLILQATVGK